MIEFQGNYSINSTKIDSTKINSTEIDSTANEFLGNEPTNIDSTNIDSTKIEPNNIPLIHSKLIQSKLIQLKQKDIPKYRELIIKEQQGLCAICKETLPIDEKNGISLDHQHRTKNEPIGQNGAGLIRGVLCRDCNVFEGKIWNNSKRYGKFKTLPQFLRAVADYLEKDNYPYIHPTEQEKPKYISKRQYNLLVKAHNTAHNNLKEIKNPKNPKEIPPFPEKRKPSQKLLNLFAKYNISPYNN